MRAFRRFLTGFLLILFVPLSWLIWQQQSRPDPAAVLLPTLAATAALPAGPLVTITAAARPTLPATFTPAVAASMPAEDPMSSRPVAALPDPIPSDTPTPEQEDATAGLLTSAEPTVAVSDVSISATSPVPTSSGQPCPEEPRLKPEYQR